MSHPSEEIAQFENKDAGANPEGEEAEEDNSEGKYDKKKGGFMLRVHKLWGHTQ
jgi:hypothetical protein